MISGSSSRYISFGKLNDYSEDNMEHETAKYGEKEDASKDFNSWNGNTEESGRNEDYNG